ncbi:MAG: ABC transporter substrate-binding protein [Proteobacteria bacterium]|nr:ABC transporter substrate-binding protein [Pseudomonadota bacterium]MBU1546853.1 ABC transporter substrate-binding protein [Pseudomonadota bacterium]MBU2618867.1 ABC transporter substrate-binding protein [Pseudomonadota bacterium]
MNLFRLAVTMFFFFPVLLPMASAAVAAEPLRFAYQNRIGDAVSIIALNKDFFAEEGLRVKGLLFNNGAACAEAIFTGAVDVATMGDTAALLAVSREPALRIIASHGSGEKRHRIIVPPTSPIRSLTDLKGKRIGVKKGTSTHGGFLALLAAKGISYLDLQIIDLDPAFMPDALAARSLDAFVASEPTPSLAEQKRGRELADLGGLGNNYPLLILVKTSLMSKRNEELHRFMRALARAEQFVHRYPEETALLLSKETGLSPEMVGKAMQRHSYRLQLDGVTTASLGQTATFLKEQHKLNRVPELSDVITTHYLQQLGPPQPGPAR